MSGGRATEDKDFPTYYCSYCSETFKTSVAKYRHMVKDHETKYSADLTPSGWNRQKTKFKVVT